MIKAYLLTFLIILSGMASKFPVEILNSPYTGDEGSLLEQKVKEIVYTLNIDADDVLDARVNLFYGEEPKKKIMDYLIMFLYMLHQRLHILSKL